VTEATHEQQTRRGLGEGDATLYAVAVQHIQHCVPVRSEGHALFSKRHCRQEDSLHTAETPCAFWLVLNKISSYTYIWPACWAVGLLVGFTPQLQGRLHMSDGSIAQRYGVCQML